MFSGSDIAWRKFEECANAGDYFKALCWLDSGRVAAGIVKLNVEYGLNADEAATVLREHWNRCDAHRNFVEPLLAIFGRAGYVSDTGRILAGVVTAYRGNLGEDPGLGISWTLSKAKARFFALYAFESPRARLLKLERADGLAPAPTVWRGVVNAEDVLGYFGQRGESEVVLNPSTIRDVTTVLRPRAGGLSRQIARRTE